MKLACVQSPEQSSAQETERARSPYAQHVTSEMGAATPSRLISNTAWVTSAHEGEPTGAHDDQPIILFRCDLVGDVVQVLEVDVGERSDMRLKLCLACPPE